MMDRSEKTILICGLKVPMYYYSQLNYRLSLYIVMHRYVYIRVENIVNNITNIHIKKGGNKELFSRDFCLYFRQDVTPYSRLHR